MGSSDGRAAGTATADASSSIAGGNPVTDVSASAFGRAGSNLAEAGAGMGASVNASEAGQAATSAGSASGVSELSAAKTLGFDQKAFFFGDGTNSTHDFKDGRAVRPARKSTNLSSDARRREVDSHAGAGLLRHGGQPGLRPSGLARRASRRAGLQPGLLVRARGSGGRRAAQPPLRLPPGHVRLKTAHAHPQHQPPRRSAVPLIRERPEKNQTKTQNKIPRAVPLPRLVPP